MCLNIQAQNRSYVLNKHVTSYHKQDVVLALPSPVLMISFTPTTICFEPIGNRTDNLPNILLVSKMFTCSDICALDVCFACVSLYQLKF